MPETINAMQASAAALGIFLLNTEAMPSPTSQRPSRTLQTCTALFSAKPVCAGTKAFDQLSPKKVALCFFEDNLGISHDAKTHVIDFQSFRNFIHGDSQLQQTRNLTLATAIMTHMVLSNSRMPQPRTHGRRMPEAVRALFEIIATE